MTQEEDRQPSEPEQATDQGTVGWAPDGGLIQGHDLLHQVRDCGPVLMPVLAHRFSQPVEQPRGRRAHRREGAAGGQVLPDHPHHQTVCAHVRTVHAEGQQRQPGQPCQHRVNYLGRQGRQRPSRPGKPSRAAAWISDRRTPAADSTASRSITAPHAPPSAPART